MGGDTVVAFAMILDTILGGHRGDFNAKCSGQKARILAACFHRQMQWRTVIRLARAVAHRLPVLSWLPAYNFRRESWQIISY